MTELKGKVLAILIALLAIAGCSAPTNTATAPVLEQPKNYLAASGVKTFRYMDGDTSNEPARYVLEKQSSEITDILIYADSGTHWNTYSCKPNGTLSYLYSVSPDGEKDAKYAKVETSRFCHSYLDSEGKVSGIAVTENRAESKPDDAIRKCPEQEECILYKVNTRWAAIGNIDLVLSDNEEQAVDRRQAVVSASEKQSDADRKWAEGDVEDLKKACQMGQKHWTLCPDGYDKK